MLNTFKDSSLFRPLSAGKVESVILVRIKRSTRRRFIAAMFGAERSVMAVLERSAIEIQPIERLELGEIIIAKDAAHQRYIDYQQSGIASFVFDDVRVTFLQLHKRLGNRSMPPSDGSNVNICKGNVSHRLGSSRRRAFRDSKCDELNLIRRQGRFAVRRHDLI